jgi:hypothetical protein
MTFHAEARDLQTSACVQVNETVYSQAGWWESPAANAGAPERAFKAVIAAILQKDKAALLKATDPTEAADTKGFDEQAGAFFKQFEMLELLSAPRSYEFDRLAVFFIRVRSARKIFYAPLVFARQSDGSFGFLPHRSRSTTFQMVEDWFQAKWGPAGSDNPVYCTDDQVKGATHRVSLDPSTDPQVAHPGRLFLKGASLDTPGDLATKVKARVAELKATLTDKGIDDFIKLLTPEGGNRLKQWYASAEDKERNVYKASITEQQPFFLFDASPLLVVYLKPPTGRVQVMYFTIGAANELLWTNSSHITVADRIFKNAPLYDAAGGEKPFSSVVNR